MSKTTETVTTTHSTLTCDQCGYTIESFEDLKELEKDAALAGWSFCWHHKAEDTVETLEHNIHDANLHFCSDKCYDEWLADQDINHAMKQDGHGRL